MNKKAIQSILSNIETEINRLQSEDIDFNSAIELLKQRKKNSQKKTLPISIFKNKKLSSLETITKYLKENLNLNYKEIAVLLNRNYGPIAVTYRNSKKKMREELRSSKSLIKIPTKIFSNKKLSVLENLTFYLKNKEKLPYHKIAKLLNRDDRTIWTTVDRAMKKLKVQNG